MKLVKKQYIDKKDNIKALKLAARKLITRKTFKSSDEQKIFKVDVYIAKESKLCCK